MKIKSNAAGHDELPIKFIKLILPYIISPLTHLLNHCFTTSSFPQSWKIATITPIAKKTDAQLCSDFRPISILPCLSKVSEMLMSEQITQFVSDNGLISPFQSGFKKGHSCSTALVRIMEDVRSMFDSDMIILLCLLDFSKAFDEVIHELLLLKLKNVYGFQDSAIKLMASYLSNRLQRVRVGNSVSEYREVKSGVPQGSILGPLLFSLFVNDLLTLPLNSKVHGYADDIQLYLGRRAGLIEDLCCRVNEDLQLISNWATANGLRLNASKSVCIPISHSPIIVEDLPQLSIGDDSINYVQKARNLGVIFNSKLSCSDHVSHVVSKVYGGLRGLRMSASFTPLEVRSRLAKQLLLPLITYASNVYCKLDSASAHKMQMAFNFVVRYVFGLKKFEHISDHTRSFLNCSLFDYIDKLNLLFLNKILTQKSPPYLYDKIQFLKSSRSHQILVPSYNYYNSTRLFFVSTIRLWNALPANIRQIGSERSLKRLI